MTDGPPAVGAGAFGAVAIGAVVLAAGGSSRLGAPKQLLAYGGRPLVRRAAEAALAAASAPVVVVLGARADDVREALAGLPVHVVVNGAWAEGMSTSVAAGVRALLDATADGPALDGALLTLADQPLVDAAALGALVQAFAERPTPIVAAEYGDVVGAPALFARARLDALLALPPGDRGAGALLRGAAAHELTRVPLAAAALDVDTPADAAALAATALAEAPDVEAGA